MPYLHEETAASFQMITFGPIPSRRLGRSLGIDLIPLKTCTYNCVYCQLGPTRRPTIRRRHFLGAGEVVSAVRAALQRKPGVDVLTFSGSGEPTLQRGLGEIIQALKANFSLPVAVLTNGALLHRSEVRGELKEADIVLPSLDAWTERMFQRINRPHPSLRLSQILEGLEAFRELFPGELWLEVLFVRGINDGEDELTGLLHWVGRIRPDRVQINTVVRPPAEQWAQPVARRTLEEIRSVLGPRAEIIADFRREAERAFRESLEERVVEMVRRRPLAPEDLVDAMGIGLEEAQRTLERLAARFGWLRERYGKRTYVRLPSE